MGSEMCIRDRGITVLDNKIFQLTYQSKTGLDSYKNYVVVGLHNTVLFLLLCLRYVYDRQNFALLKSFKFMTDSEQGWGLTTNGSHLIVSDGTNKLYLWDPAKLGVDQLINIRHESISIRVLMYNCVCMEGCYQDI